jgi:hypothetical protein
MILERDFNTIYKGNKDLQYKLKGIINRTLSGVDFSKNGRYWINPKNNAVYYRNGDTYEWSWMNSINTNYGCLYLLVSYVDTKFERSIGLLDFESLYIDDTLSYIESKLNEDKQIIFTPKSDIFKGMFFTTQKTWNWGLISEISAILTLKQNYDIGEVNVNYKRGDLKDMNQGTDLELYFEGSYKNTQHKSSYLNDEKLCYTSYSFIYNESTYRENLDLITIDSKNKIYLFRNSKDTSLCGTRNKQFFINKTLKINEMEKENQEFTNLLTDINRICFEKKYIFNFEKTDSGENYFEDTTNNSIREIKFFLNDINDENLINIVKEQISKL